MKKISLLILSITVGLFASAQFAQTPSASAKKMTAEEANKLNGVAQPTINGKPYSQYKAEQEALKAKQQPQTNALPSSTVAPVTVAKDAGAAVPVSTSQVVVSAPTVEKQPASLQTTPTTGKPKDN
jgi:hypothetical protein